MSLNLPITRIQHIGIPVTSLARSQAFYEGLGFAAVMTSTFPHPEGTGHVVMMRQGEVTIELYELPAPALETIRARSNGHVDHVAFDTTDVDAAFETLKAAGYTIDEPEPMYLGFWRSGCKYFNVIGPDGERLEFNQIL